MKSSTKFLGVILDSKLTWNDHITNQCKKAKGILMQCRKAVGPTWGFNGPGAQPPEFFLTEFYAKQIRYQYRRFKAVDNTL